jgi:hypothetical protein
MRQRCQNQTISKMKKVFDIKLNLEVFPTHTRVPPGSWAFADKVQGSD